MKVAFIFLHPFSSSLGSVVRVRELAISLHKLGVESYILTPYENDHSISEGVNVVSIGGRMRKLGLDGYLYKIARFAYYNRFFVRHFMISQRSQSQLASRLASAITSALGRLDVDIVQAEQDVALLTGLQVREKTGLPLSVDLHNITAEELVAAGVINKESREFEALQQLSAEALQRADSVVVVSDEMKDYVEAEYGVSPKRVSVVYHGGRPKIEKIEKKKFPPMVVYSGLVTFREHVDLFVKSMAVINERLNGVQFCITRKGEAMGKIKELARKLKVNPVYFWYPDVAEFYKFLISCHVGVLPSSNDLARKMGTSVKLFDYLSVGLPVVANNVGTWTSIVKKEKVGILTEDDPADFAAGILELVQNREFAEECGARGLELVKDQFNWDNSAKALLNEYSRLLGH